jgi:hypothetical protein
MRVGLVYAYRDPISYRWAYVGSIQNQLTLKHRHVRHLRDDSTFDVWLQGMYAKGWNVKPEVMQYVGYDHVDQLFAKENEWIDNFGTLFPNGYNLVMAGGADHAAIGHFGGSKNVESGHLARLRTKEHQSMAGSAGAIVRHDEAHRADPNYRIAAAKGGGAPHSNNWATRLGIKQGEEEKKKRTESIKKAYIRAKETGTNMGMMGKSHPDEWKKAMSARLTGNKINLGRKQSEEERKKRSEALKKFWVEKKNGIR